jgi:hypothetical protein
VEIEELEGRRERLELAARANAAELRDAMAGLAETTRRELDPRTWFTERPWTFLAAAALAGWWMARRG